MSSEAAVTEKIVQKGESIRELKSSKADPAAIKAAVADLLALKAEFKTVTGKDYVAPGQGSSKKKKKGGDGGAPKPKEGGEVSKKQANKDARKKAKAEAQAKAAAEREEKRKAELAAQGTAATVESDASLFGDAPLITSHEMTDKVWVDIKNLSPEMADVERYVRGRMHVSRKQGKGCFFLLRQGLYTVQGVLFQGKNVSKQMVAYLAEIPPESVVDIRAVIRVAPELIKAATQSSVELHVLEVHVISKAAPVPFQLDDAARPDGDESGAGVGQDTRLNYRWVDTRTPANQAIFNITSGVGGLFREFLHKRGFVEIHTPKINMGAAEGGAEIFHVDYFNQKACLAQSPQLYKQMVAACGGFEKVYEVGPVFRAENSNTHRHLCEFTGLDMEMTFKEHYYEVLQVFSDLFIFIFDQLNRRYRDELETIRAQHPFEDLKFLQPSLRLSFAEGVAMLNEAGFSQDPNGDLSTENEKALGKLVKDKYDTDFFMMDKYPLAARPFYTMPCPENPEASNSYDFFIRGEEIMSGAQRIHDVALIVERAKAHGIPEAGIQSYIDAFKHGAEPHGGGGVGLERVVMLFLGLKNIRKASMFPRDPTRLTP